MELNTILVAVDAPNPRDAAFARALALAHTSGAALYVLHAVPANQPFSYRAAERLRRMTAMRERAEGAGVRVRTVEQHGDPAEIIELHANARAVDLIVIGSDVRRGWSRGSRIAEHVVRRTKVPTLVVASHGGRADTPAVFRNVLVAVDLSPRSADLLAHAMSVTTGDLEQLTVMHVTRRPADAQQALWTLASETPARADTRLHLATGTPARAITEHATEIGADLVVVGRSRGFTLLGSTALGVLRQNERALLVVPATDARIRRREHQLAA